MNFYGMISKLLMNLESVYGSRNHLQPDSLKSMICNMPQVGLLLLESLLLLGHFALFHPGNQAVLRWGKSPTILHKVSQVYTAFLLTLVSTS